MWSQAGRLRWEARAYETGDGRDAFLVLSVADAKTNAQVFEEAETHRTFCNAVDDIEHCNCYASAVVRRGPLQIAISTAGKSPALAQRLRKELEERFGQEYGLWVTRLGELRSRLFQDKAIDSETRRRTLHEQASASAFENFSELPLTGEDFQNSGRDPEGWRESRSRGMLCRQSDRDSGDAPVAKVSPTIRTHGDGKIGAR